MKSLDLSTEVMSDQRIMTLVNRAQAWLEDLLGPQSTRLVDAKWSSKQVGARTLVVLNLSDWTWPQGVETLFEVDDLAVESRARQRLHRAWGDLLQARNHQQLRELEQLVGKE